MSKITVKKPIVDINGDEMARVLWEMISDNLIDPFLDIKRIKYDLSIKTSFSINYFVFKHNIIKKVFDLIKTT